MVGEADAGGGIPADLYHEQQSYQLCALHVLNNLLGRRELAKADMDRICRQLAPGAWINPHRSVLGLGNYDANVIMAALQERGLEMRWFDKRRYAERDLQIRFGSAVWKHAVPLPWRKNALSKVN